LFGAPMIVTRRVIKTATAVKATARTSGMRHQTGALTSALSARSTRRRSARNNETPRRHHGVAARAASARAKAITRMENLEIDPAVDRASRAKAHTVTQARGAANNATSVAPLATRTRRRKTRARNGSNRMIADSSAPATCELVTSAVGTAARYATRHTPAAHCHT